VPGVALRDYVAWHDAYDRPGSDLHLRLLVVQDLIAQVLDERPPGPVPVVGICAGRGRDVLTVAARHRRGDDLGGRLVELDPTNAAGAREAIAALGPGAPERGEVLEADAGLSDAYAGAPRAQLLLACGVFGNVSVEDIRGTIAALPALCAPGAHVVWTRRRSDDTIVPTVEGWFAEAGFEPVARVVSEIGFGVGAGRLTIDPPPPLPPGRRLFTFIH
jgi:hypothetical protein